MNQMRVPNSSSILNIFKFLSFYGNYNLETKDFLSKCLEDFGEDGVSQELRDRYEYFYSFACNLSTENLSEDFLETEVLETIGMLEDTYGGKSTIFASEQWQKLKVDILFHIHAYHLMEYLKIEDPNDYVVPEGFSADKFKREFNTHMKRYEEWYSSLDDEYATHVNDFTNHLLFEESAKGKSKKIKRTMDVEKLADLVSMHTNTVNSTIEHLIHIVQKIEVDVMDTPPPELVLQQSPALSSSRVGSSSKKKRATRTGTVTGTSRDRGALHEEDWEDSRAAGEAGPYGNQNTTSAATNGPHASSNSTTSQSVAKVGSLLCILGILYLKVVVYISRNNTQVQNYASCGWCGIVV